MDPHKRRLERCVIVSAAWRTWLSAEISDATAPSTTTLADTSRYDFFFSVANYRLFVASITIPRDNRGKERADRNRFQRTYFMIMIKIEYTRGERPVLDLARCTCILMEQIALRNDTIAYKSDASRMRFLCAF